MENKILISINTINMIMQYLDSRPHGEVRALIDTIIKDVNDSNNTNTPESKGM